jgi:hypothetical protein
MSEWITDRLPMEEDSDINGMVWTIDEESNVYNILHSSLCLGNPWIRRNKTTSDDILEHKRWKPCPNQYYWEMDYTGGVLWRYNVSGIDDKQYEYGNCFQTSAQAIEAARRVRETLLNYHKELNNDQMES